MTMYPGAAIGMIMLLLVKWWDEGLCDKETILHGLTKGPDGNVNVILLVLASMLTTGMF
jgi:hypothetical protein